MKKLVRVTTYLLFYSGTIIAVSGILIILGIINFPFGMLSVDFGEIRNIFQDGIRNNSIALGGISFVGGLLVMAESEILEMLSHIAYTKTS